LKGEVKVKKVFSWIMFALLLMGMLALAFNIQSAKASGTIYIRADGSIDPPTPLIATVHNVTYTLTGNITSDADGIVVERSNIIIDGNGYTLQGSGNGDGFKSTNVNNVTIKNVIIEYFSYGVYLESSSDSQIIANNVTANYQGRGIGLYESSNNLIVGNNVTNMNTGIWLCDSGYDIISGNEITSNTNGIMLDSSSHNSVFGNTITDCYYDGILLGDAHYNSIRGNNITNSSGNGIWLSGSHYNSIVGNDITNNDVGLCLAGYMEAGENSIYHNNFLNNTEQVHFGYVLYLGQPMTSFNVWDYGYPSGGNYWSDYNGTDSYSGAFQNETGSDSIGDTPYVNDADNRDNYPLMTPHTPSEHELIATITAPTFMRLGKPISLEAILTNEGSNDETDVKLELLINETIFDSTTIPILKANFPYTLNYQWTPTIEGIHNVTLYAHPVGGETSVENNKMSKTVIVGPPLKIGVRAGDWIKCTYTISGWPSGTPYPEWLKVEFLSVDDINATIRVTMRMSDGTEPSQTMTIDVVAGGVTFQGLSGFVIPTNCTTGYPIYITGYGNVTIAGENIRAYAGASRTVVHANVSQYGTQITYYWDKQTGVMVEASTTSGTMTATGKATETNIWQAQSTGLPIDPPVLYALITAVVVIVFAALLLVKRRKKKPPEVESPPS
jgi:parallel beta-helix repeat protein